jgi:hypothetical protein
MLFKRPAEMGQIIESREIASLFDRIILPEVQDKRIEIFKHKMLRILKIPLS